MGLFDYFNFKKKFQEVATKENFDKICAIAREKIIAQVKEDIEGSEKMDHVVDDVVAYIKENIKSDNGLVQWIIDNILIPNVRIITQAIYDYLKEKVKGL